MNDRKPRRVLPQVEVVRRPNQTPAPEGQATVAPRPVTPSGAPVRPSTPGEAVARPVVPVAPRPVTPSSGSASLPPRPTGPRPYSPSPRPSFGEGPRGAGPRPPFRPSAPRPPPTPEAVEALARKERVPARIAKGELEGKMKCRIWKKLHAEEAKRFDQVYTLLGQHPELTLADGFALVQSGMSLDELQARRERTQRKTAVKQARGAVDNAAVAGLLEGLRSASTELSVVLGDRTLLDVLVGEEPIALQLQRAGRVEKLQVVALARREQWEGLVPQLPRDARLAQKPVPVARQPERRPFSDPRPFLDHLGEQVRLGLRNGLQLVLPLRTVGRFDLVLGEEGSEVMVPLHALLHWEAVNPSAEGDGEAQDDGAQLNEEA